MDLIMANMAPGGTRGGHRGDGDFSTMGGVKKMDLPSGYLPSGYLPSSDLPPVSTLVFWGNMMIYPSGYD